MRLRKPITGLFSELSRKAIAAFDRLCARHSKVGDAAIFDQRDFPWLPAIEADWRKVRAELDAVLPYMAHMQDYRDVLPSYPHPNGLENLLFLRLRLESAGQLPPVPRDREAAQAHSGHENSVLFDPRSA